MEMRAKTVCQEKLTCFFLNFVIDQKQPSAWVAAHFCHMRVYGKLFKNTIILYIIYILYILYIC
jgi:hypothetical protein